MSHYAAIILNCINESYDHPTAEQIFFRLKQSEPKIVLATVYNNLNRLTEKGLIRKIGVEGEADRYDRVLKHDHLVCASCGRLADFEFKDLTESLTRQLDAGVIKYDLKVYYECPACREKKKNQSF